VFRNAGQWLVYRHRSAGCRVLSVGAGLHAPLKSPSVFESFGRVRLPLPRAAAGPGPDCAAAPQVSSAVVPGTSCLRSCCAVVNANVALFTL